MFDLLKPFLRLLMAVPMVFCFGYLSFFTPYHLLHGEGFTSDLQLALVVIGVFTGLLFFSRPHKGGDLVDPLYLAEEGAADEEGVEETP